MTQTIERTGFTIPPLPEIDDVTRREFLIGAGSLLVLAPYGCGGSGESGEGASGETRVVRDANGNDVEVPVDPRRVVVVDYRTALITAIDLGVPVVGSVTPVEGSFPLLTEEESGGIKDVGAFPQPNLEKITLLEPDLIVGWSTGMEGVYKQLSRIAPTVATGANFDKQWKAGVREAAAAFGREGEMEGRISAFEERAQRFARRNSALLAQTEVSLVRIDTDLPRVYTEQHYNGAVMKEAGVRRPKNQRIEDPEVSNYDVSLERIPELDGDVLLYFVGGGVKEQEAADQALERIRSNPLWSRLRAVRNDRVYRVDAAQWFESVSLRGANLILDDLNRYLVGEEGSRE